MSGRQLLCGGTVHVCLFCAGHWCGNIGWLRPKFNLTSV